MIKIITLTAILLLSSCVTQRKCEEKFGECGKVQTVIEKEYKDTTIYIKGREIIDTLSFYERDTFYLKDTTGSFTAVFEPKTRYIRITSKPDTLVITKVKEVIKEGSVKYVNRDKIPFWIWLIIGGLSLGLLGALFRR